MSDIYSLILDADGLVLSAIQSNLLASGGVAVDVDTFDRAKGLVGRATYINKTLSPKVLAPSVPASAALSDWRIGLTLWGRIDDVKAKIDAIVASPDPKLSMTGKIAAERLQYANTVIRSELVALKDAFGFSQSDVDESMWRAAQVAKGDLSGVWPLPATS